MDNTESTNKRGRKPGPVKVAFMRRVLPELVPILESVIEDGVESKVINRVHEVVNDGSERVKRLQAELETCDRARQEAAKQIQVRQDEIVRLKEERKAENDPSLPARENIALKKKIQVLTAGILKDAEKIDRMERLLAVMVEWDLPTFESWKIAKQNEFMNKKHEVSDVDQEAGT